MISRLRTLAWSYMSLAALPAIGVTFAIILLPAGFGRMVGLTPGRVEGLDFTRTFFLSYVAVATFALNTMAWTPLASLLRRSRLLPLSTRTLALFYLFLPALLVMCLNAIILTGFNYLYNSDWPVFVTSCWFGVTTVIGAAAGAWLREVRFRFTWIVPVVVAGWIYWILTHFFPHDFRAPPELWVRLSPADVVVFAGVVIASILVWCPAWQRYREGVPMANWLRLLTDHSPAFSGNDAQPVELKFADRDAAFLDLAWKQSRLLMFGTEVIMVFMVALVTIVCLRSEHRVLERTMVFMPIFGFMIGLMVGLFVTMQSWLQTADGRLRDSLKTSLTTLPFSDADLGRLIMRSWLPAFRRLVLILCAAGITVFLIYALIFGAHDYVRQYLELKLVQHLGPLGGLAWILGMLALMWAVAGNMGSMVLAGRPKLALWSIVYTFGTIVVIVWSWNFGGENGRAVGRILLLLLTVLTSTAVSVLLLYHAARRQLLTGNQTLLCAAAGAAMFAVVFALVPLTPYWKCVYAGLTLFAVSPFPGIPLAVAVNRHR